METIKKENFIIKEKFNKMSESIMLKEETEEIIT